MTSSSRDTGLRPDLASLKRYVWLPILSLAIAVTVALVLNAATSTSNEARFRANVLVNALPPLFGPSVLPGPFDYARLATSDPVVQRVADASGVPADQLRPRLSAEAQFNRSEIDFKVSGSNALAIARSWQQAFLDATAQRTPDLERELARPYTAQLEQVRAQLAAAAASSSAAPLDPVLQQQLKAAEENYETASRLTQSYEVVATTMKAQAFTVVGPHLQRGGVGSPMGRLGAAVAFGLLVGVLGALLLDFAARRRTSPASAFDQAPATLLRDSDRRAGSSTR